MRFNRLLFFLLTTFFLSLVLLLFKRNSPFGWQFWTAVHVLSISLGGMLIWLGIFFWRKGQAFKKVIASIVFCLAGLLLLSYTLSIIDYRILLPFTRASSLSASQYEEELTYFQQKLKTHPAYSPSIDSAANKQLYHLQTKLEVLERDDYVTALMRMLALFEDGHSYVLPFQMYNRARYLPLAGHYFQEGFFILSTSDEYAALKNKQLVKINDIPFETIMEEISRLTGPENEWNAKARLNFFLFSVNCLQSLDIVTDKRKVELTYIDSDRSETRLLVSSEPFLNWAFWALKPGSNRLPVLSHLRKPNYQLHLKKDRIELELNLIEPISDENTLKELASTLDSLLDQSSKQSLIIDLRNNLGGNNHLYAPLIQVIQAHPEINQKDMLFVWISRNTFSAGINFLDDLRHKTNATFVGEPTGAGPTHYGDANFIRLPHSGIFLFLSSKQWMGRDSSDTRRTIPPDIPIQFTFEKYNKNIDPWRVATDSFIRHSLR